MLARRVRNKENGVAMLEMALVAPFFLILLISVFDISRCINIHSQLVSIAQEGLRTAATVAYLEPQPWSVQPHATQFNNPAQDIYKMDSGTGYAVVTAGTQGPVRILRRIAQVLRARQNDLNIQRNNWIITSEVDYSTAPNQLTIFVRVKYSGLFYLFNGLNIEAQAIGPYTT